MTAKDESNVPLSSKLTELLFMSEADEKSLVGHNLGEMDLRTLLLNMNLKLST